MEVAKLAAPPNLEVRFVSCNESAIKRWLSSELEETMFSLTHELFMTKHHTVTNHSISIGGRSLILDKNLYFQKHPFLIDLYWWAEFNFRQEPVFSEASVFKLSPSAYSNLCKKEQAGLRSLWQATYWLTTFKDNTFQVKCSIFESLV